MKWKRRKSKDVIDVRGASPKAGSSGGGGGGIGGLPIPSGLAGKGGGLGLIIVLVIVRQIRRQGSAESLNARFTETDELRGGDLEAVLEGLVCRRMLA